MGAGDGEFLSLIEGGSDLTDDVRRKKEKRPVGVGATAVGVVVVAESGGESFPLCADGAGAEKLLSIGGSGDAGTLGFSIPISFIVAFRRSLSRRSSSSS